jgi:sugar lactone lactonase YvrE
MRVQAAASAVFALSALLASAGPEDPQQGGKWDPPVTWSFVPVSAATLPDGRILGWASNERLTFPAGPERTYTSVWDPQTGQFLDILHPTHDMFCGNQVMLEDGTVYVTGGRNQGNSPWTSMFDYRSNQWIQRENMNRGRWYPTSVALPNGKVFIAIGEGGGNTAELWDGVSQWSLLSGLNFDVPILNYTHGERNWTPLMQLAPDGRIFHLGPTPKMHMIDTTGVGSITQVGPQITAWYPKDSATVMYDQGKILTAGGWISGTNTASSARAMVIDINGASPQVTDIGNMAFARRFHNAVTLPNGEVALFGGNTSGEKFSDLGAVLAVEIFNPTTTPPTFRLGASMSVPRNYHSVALLMVDGRVWSGGGGLCGCTADHPDAQIWSPPYLFNADGTLAVRPELYSAPGKVVAGSTITVRGTPNITRFSLVKMSTETHSNNSDMRYLTASSQQPIAGEYNVTLHSNPNVLTPGYWMLFGSNAQGTPSVAKVIQVSTLGTSSGPPVLRDISGFTHAKNTAIDMTLNVIEPDGSLLTFTATGLPPGISLGTRSGRLFGTVTTSGTYAVTITVSDGVSSDSTSFTWRVVDNLGLNYEYFQGSFDVLPNFDALTALKEGTVPNFTLAPRLQEDFYAFRFRGRIDITTAGSYRFFTTSDDGSRLLIDGTMVVNNDGLHGAVEQFGDITLGVGKHTIEVTFFEKTGGASLSVSYQGPGIAKQFVPDTVLLGVAPANQPPNVTNPGDRSNVVGAAVTLGITASDPNAGDVLTYSATGLPTGLSINASTGTISGTVTTAGVYGVQVTVTDGALSTLVSFTWTVTTPNSPPTIQPITNRQGLVGDVVSLQVSASDPNGDPISYSATNLPPGLSIGQTSGTITGTLGSAGFYTATVTVSDGPQQASTSFDWNVMNPVVPLTMQPIKSPPREADTPIAFTVSATGTGTLSYRWSWGDGSPTESFSSSPSRTYTYADPGRYVVTVTVRDSLGEASQTFTQAIYATPTAVAGTQDSTIIIESVTGTPRVWNVNPDTNTVTIINANTYAKVAEIAVGVKPSSLALAGDGRIWVANKRSNTITRIDPITRTVFGQLTLPRGSAPHGLVVNPASGDALVVLEATGQLIRLNGTTGAITGQLTLGANVRHLSVSGDGTRIYVSRFVTPPLPGEDTAAPSTLRNGQPAGGEVLVVDATNLTLATTIVLEHSNATISEHSAPGLPNYLRAPALSPDGLSAWVPSKQDNVLRGTLRNGAPLDHDHTVRAITSRIDLATQRGDLNDRIDHDNASIASAAAFDRTGSYLFVALEGNRMVAVLDAYRGEELFRFASGRAPEGLVMHPDGKRLFVQNLMDRTVSVHDLSTLIDTGANLESRLATVTTIATETLNAQVLLGKQHFYDALDGRLAKESYMACAACHNDGGQDGRTWDFTGFREGLRNTITLDGQGGVTNGPVHWTGNFDEIQDFEGQIRNFVLGTGLMSDASFHTGTRSEPLGDPKAGLSADLDALAAYLGSLATVPTSPYRAANGALTTTAEAGKNVFIAKDCGSCHAGARFTDSALDKRHDIGTIKTTSGSRLGAALDGFDTPTLRGLWATAPYLHDGSAATLGAAIDAHSGVALTTTDRSNLVDYLLQIDATEPIAVRQAANLEALTVSGVTSAAWTPVTLATRYVSLVAACTIHQSVNTTPQVVRMRQVAPDRIEVRLQSPEARTLSGEKLYCLAAEEGKWLLPDGRKLEARKYQSTRVDRTSSWVGEQRTYLQSFTTPVVLGQVMSYNDTRWSTFWARGSAAKNPPSGALLYTGYMVGEDSVTTRASETIGYLVFESGSGTLSTIPYEVKVGPDTVRGWDNSTTGYAYTFGRSYPGPRVILASQVGMDGADGSFAIIRGAAGSSATAVRLTADEDNVRDSERSHSPEQVSYFVIDQPTVIALTPAP